MTRADYSDVVIVEIPAVYCEKRRCESVSQKRGLRYASCSRNKATSIQLGLQLEAQLLKDVPAWEAGNGRQFLVNSEPFLQLLEETLCAEEAQRESRKVCGDHLSVNHRSNRLYIASPSGFGGWPCNNTSSSSVNPPQRSGHAGSPHGFWLFEGIRFVRPIEEEAKT